MIFLIITIIGDVIGVALLDKAKGFTHPWLFVSGLACMVIGFSAFSFATKTIPGDIANALWSGLSVILVFAVGWLYFDYPMSVPKALFAGMILIGVVGLQFVSTS